MISIPLSFAILNMFYFFQQTEELEKGEGFFRVLKLKLAFLGQYY